MFRFNVPPASRRRLCLLALPFVAPPFRAAGFTLLLSSYFKSETSNLKFLSPSPRLMLEGGADIRYIQAMLGHKRLDMTQIYTHVSIRMLQQVHAATHPAARLSP